MGTSPFENYEGALAAYAAITRKPSDQPTFSNAVIYVRTINPVDEFTAASAIGAVGKHCRRLYALVKYGNPRRRLSRPEREESKPGVSRPSTHELRFDFQPLLERLWGFASSWSPCPLQKSLFEPFLNLIDAKTTRLDQAGTRQLLRHLINVAGAVAVIIGVAYAGFDAYVDYSLRAGSSQIALLDDPALQVGKRTTTTFAKSDRAKFERDTERKLVEAHRILTNLAAGDPVVKFVGAQVEQFRPALFDVLASSGGGLINGVEFTQTGATRSAKSARRNVRQGIGVWSTTVSVDI